MIAMPVAENQPVEPLGLDAEQVEIPRQDLGGVSKIEQGIARSRRRLGTRDATRGPIRQPA
jgi:hypothetical protein